MTANKLTHFDSAGQALMVDVAGKKETHRVARASGRILMVRTAGLRYTCRPNAPMGKRIDNLILGGTPLDASRRYKVASWAPVAEGASGKAIWDIVIPYLRAQKVIRAPQVNRPTVVSTG